MYMKIVHDVDIEQMQDALTFWQNGPVSKQLDISIEKHCVLNIGQQIASTHFCTGKWQQSVTIVSQMHYLGVLVCNNLSFTNHHTC